jgi:ABC-type antimicrobial peptide transport system permease subunit
VHWFGRVFALQGWALVGIASFGILSFMRLWVDSLGGEIALRRSVGARRRQILWWILRRAFGVAVKGVLAGVWFGIAVWSALPDVVSGALSWDPAGLLPYALLIVVLVLSGALPPAWRLSRIRPAELL